MTALRAHILTPHTPHVAHLLRDHVLTIGHHGQIVSVEPFAHQPITEDLRHIGVLTPGFVDAHVHFPQAQVVGQASGPLLSWLSQSIFPEEAKFASNDYARHVADRFVDDMIHKGTTTAMVYGSVHAAACDAFFHAAHARNFRTIAGPVWMDQQAPPALCVDAQTQADAVLELARRWHDPHHQTTQVAVIPRFAISCSSGMLSRAAQLATQLALPITTHLAETQEECRVACALHGAKRYLDIYRNHDLLRPGTVFAHNIHLDDTDWRTLKDNGAVIAHCPDSNDFLGSGSMPLQKVLDYNLPFCLGSDVAAGRSLSIPHTIQAAFDNALRQNLRMPNAFWLWSSTIGGAVSLGFDHVGKLEPNWQADMVLFKMSQAFDHVDQAMNAIFFDSDHRHISRVWIAGTEQINRCE